MECITLLDKDTPDLVQDSLTLPSLEGAVDGAVVAEFPWQVVPLAARASTVDDTIECLPLINS